MEISVQMPLDSDGFLRRECPHCLQQFKWHFGPASEEAESQPVPPVYHCPLCGRSAGPDSWWTQEQLDFAQQSAMPAVGRVVQDELAKAFRGNKHLTYKPGSGSGFSDESTPLVETDDMQIVASPCHAFEPVKVPEGLESVHCLICGAAFAF